MPWRTYWAYSCCSHQIESPSKPVVVAARGGGWRRAGPAYRSVQQVADLLGMELVDQDAIGVEPFFGRDICGQGLTRSGSV